MTSSGGGQHARRRDDSDPTNGGAWTAKFEHIEDSYESLRQDVREIARLQESLATEMRRAINSLADRIAANRITPWSTLAAWAGVIIAFTGAIGGLVTTGLLDRMAVNTTRVERAEEQLRSHVADGHPKRMDERVNELRTDMLTLDTTLQREMNLLDGRMRAEVHERLGSLTQRTERIEAWTDGREELTFQFAGALARIERLENDIIQLRQAHKSP